MRDQMKWLNQRLQTVYLELGRAGLLKGATEVKLQRSLFYNPQNLFEDLCAEDMLMLGFKAVRANKGAAGIDKVSVSDFEANIDKELAQLSKELQSWSYKPKPVRRVEIPKPGKKGEFRNLGIPCVRDRVVQATMKLLLEPIYEPIFSQRSFGFRPGKNQHQAIETARQIVDSGKEYCVDIDLSKFFDRIHHDRLISRMGKEIPDKRILRLIGQTLRSGVMVNGIISATSEGSVQGSPISPLLSNIVLDELDKELEKRGLEFCRFADDAQIYVKSLKAANRVMVSVTKFITNKLKLVVNEEKSQVTKSRHTKFLGMTVIGTTVAISSASMARAKMKIKELSPRNNGKPVAEDIRNFNQWYKGWSQYHKPTYFPAQFRALEAHFRRRMRAKIVKQKKRPRYLFKALKKQGIKHKTAAKTCFNNNKAWAKSSSYAMNRGFDNRWFKKQGMWTFSDKELEHWLDVGRWIWLS